MTTTADRIASREFSARRRSAAEFAVRQARELLRWSPDSALPVIAESLAARIGIRVVREYLGDLAGLLVPLDRGFEIKVNAAQPVRRQNFTCAHEIAHSFFFREEGRAILREVAHEHGWDAARNVEEELCDLGAAELLMPRESFRRHASIYDFGIESLAPLSRAFDTSLFATAIRLVDVSSRSCFLVRWMPETQAQLGEVVLRTTWVLASKGRRFQFKKMVARNSSIAEAYRSDVVTYSQECMKLGGVKGPCMMESRAFGSAPHRSVISLIFPRAGS